METGDNYRVIRSEIKAKYGVFEDLPLNFSLNESIRVIFCLHERGSLFVDFVFDGADISLEDAKILVEIETRRIALGFSIAHEISFEWKSDVESTWRENEAASTTNTVSISMRSAITKGIKFLGCSRYFIPDVYTVAFECYNNALKQKEKGSDDRAVAAWLYVAREALETEYKNKHDFEQQIVRDHVLSRKEIEDLNYSIGSFYRHHKTSSSKEPLSIEACADMISRILQFHTDR